MRGGGLRRRLGASALRVPLLWWRHRGLGECDVLLASYPKSGNTWLRFMLAHVLSGRDLGFDEVRPLIPMVGHPSRAAARLPGGGRLLKTHEPFRPQYGRAVLLVREGRDVAVSYYHHQLRMGHFSGSFAAFFESFLAGRVDGHGRWDEHVRSWLGSGLPRGERLHLVRYEDLRADPFGRTAEVVRFLGLEADDAAVRAAVEANTLARMKVKEEAATVLPPARRDIPVVRRGTGGEWSSLLDEAQLERYRARCEDVLAELGYRA